MADLDSGAGVSSASKGKGRSSDEVWVSRLLARSHDPHVPSGCGESVEPHVRDECEESVARPELALLGLLGL